MSFLKFLNKFNQQALQPAIGAAFTSGILVRNAFRKAGQADYTSKKPGDLVTEVDTTSEEIIIAYLKAAGVTDAQIISEETSSSETKRPGAQWIVDPLDSTIGFVYGLDCSSIIISYSYSGLVIVGVVYFPLTEELFFAVLDKGCWYLDDVKSSNTQKEPKRVLLSFPQEELSRARVVLNKQAEAQNESKEMKCLDLGLRTRPIAGLVTSEVPSSGIACKVASGKIGAVIHDNSPESKKQRCWDMAAPKLIVEEAGGLFCNFRGEPTNIWDYEPIIIAQSKRLMEQILDKLNS